LKEHSYILLSGLLTAFFVVLFTMPVLIKVARMKHLVDEPGDDRKLHSRSIPTIGGIIIFAAILFSYSLWFPTAANGADIATDAFRSLYREMGAAYADFKIVIAVMVLLFFIGVKDDIIGFSPAKKLVGHLIVAYILVIVGRRAHPRHARHPWSVRARAGCEHRLFILHLHLAGERIQPHRWRGRARRWYRAYQRIGIRHLALHGR
jgi:UDP-N-acetylmuramyl pentapeptide phosphotransferase/UDP-N-acetylglucosamine-1-phosphate transferase